MLYGFRKNLETALLGDMVAASVGLSLVTWPIFVWVGVVGSEVRLAGVMALTSTVLCGWDGYRYVQIATLRPHRSLIAGLLILTILGTLIFALVSVDRISVLTLAASWLVATASVLVCAMGFHRAALLQVFARLGMVWRRHRVVSRALSLEALLAAGATEFVVLVMTATAGLYWSAGYRVAMSVLLGPLTTLLMGLNPQLQMFIRRWAEEGSSVRRYKLNVSLTVVGVAAIAILYVAALRLLPDDVLRALAGDSWRTGRDLLYAAAGLVVAVSSASLLSSDLRYRLGPSRTVAVKVGTSIVCLAGFAFAVLFNGGDPREALLLYGGLYLVVPLLVLVLSRDKPLVHHLHH